MEKEMDSKDLVKLSSENYEAYLEYCEKRNKQFCEEFPDNPMKHLYCMPVLARTQKIIVRYIK